MTEESGDPSPALKKGSDYYLERGFMVFTEEYLRRRGYCCESGCRHCPWGFRRDTRSDIPSEPADDR